MKRVGIYDQVKAAIQDLVAPALHEIRGEMQAIRAEVQGIRVDIRRLDEKIDTAWGQYAATDDTGREKERASFVATLAEYRKNRDERLVPAAAADNVDAYLGTFFGEQDAFDYVCGVLGL